MQSGSKSYTTCFLYSFGCSEIGYNNLSGKCIAFSDIILVACFENKDYQLLILIFNPFSGPYVRVQKCPFFLVLLTVPSIVTIETSADLASLKIKQDFWM